MGDKMLLGEPKHAFIDTLISTSSINQWRSGISPHVDIYTNFCGAEQHQHVALCVRFVWSFCFVLFACCVQKFFSPLLGKVGGWDLVWWLYKINQVVMEGWLPFLGWSPSNYNLHKFGSQKFLQGSNLAFKRLSMRSFCWMSLMKATYLLQQENETNNWWLNWALPHSELNKESIPPSSILFLPPPPRNNEDHKTKGLLYITWKNYLWLLPLTVIVQLSPSRKCYQLFQPEIELG